MSLCDVSDHGGSEGFGGRKQKVKRAKYDSWVAYEHIPIF